MASRPTRRLAQTVAVLDPSVRLRPWAVDEAVGTALRRTKTCSAETWRRGRSAWRQSGRRTNRERRGRMEDGSQRQLWRVPARATGAARPPQHAADVRQDRRVLRRADVRDG